VQQRDRDVLKKLVREFNLTYTAFGSAFSTEDGPTAGTLTLTEAWGTPLEPAPITPFGEDSAPWQLLSGTIKATFNAHRGLDGADNIFVSPGIATGNTSGCTALLFSVIKAEVDNLIKQIRGTIGTSRVTLSGTTTMVEERASERRKAYIPSTSVCLEVPSRVWIPRRSLISLPDMPADSFVEMIRFFTTLVLNADESRKI